MEDGLKRYLNGTHIHIKNLKVHHKEYGIKNSIIVGAVYGEKLQKGEKTGSMAKQSYITKSLAREGRPDMGTNYKFYYQFYFVANFWLLLKFKLISTKL